MHLITTAFNGKTEVFNDRIAKLASIGDFTNYFENRDIGEKLAHTFCCGDTKVSALIDIFKLNKKMNEIIKRTTEATDVVEDDDKNSITFKTKHGNVKINFTDKSVTIDDSTFRYTEDGMIVEETNKKKEKTPTTNKTTIKSQPTNTVKPKKEEKPATNEKEKLKSIIKQNNVTSDKVIAKYFNLKNDKDMLQFFGKMTTEERDKFAKKIECIVQGLSKQYSEKELTNMKLLLADGTNASYEDFTLIINNTMIHCKLNPQTGKHDCASVNK